MKRHIYVHINDNQLCCFRNIYNNTIEIQIPFFRFFYFLQNCHEFSSSYFFSYLTNRTYYVTENGFHGLL
jgi:hypothetical protein